MRFGRLCYEQITTKMNNIKLIKRIIVFAASIAYIHTGYAQLEPNYENMDKFMLLDSAYLKCAYKLTYLWDSTKINNKLTDIQMLLAGETISKYYSQKKLDHNKFAEEEIKRHDSYTSFPNGVWSCELFKNYPQGKVTICDIGSVLHGNFVYEEALPVFDWTITGEIQTILSYNCRRATTSFRGRDYIAWFTLDIPIPNGPWQFGGLPGLILKLYDVKENFVFECTSIENLSRKKEFIKYYLVEYTKLSRKEYKKIDERFHEDYIRYESLHGVKMMIFVDQKTKRETRPTSLKLPYNPIELE
jgi:GLPGLI family protein